MEQLFRHSHREEPPGGRDAPAVLSAQLVQVM